MRDVGKVVQGRVVGDVDGFNDGLRSSAMWLLVLQDCTSQSWLRCCGVLLCLHCSADPFFFPVYYLMH